MIHIEPTIDHLTTVDLLQLRHPTQNSFRPSRQVKWQKSAEIQSVCLAPSRRSRMTDVVQNKTPTIDTFYHQQDSNELMFKSSPSSLIDDKHVSD